MFTGIIEQIGKIKKIEGNRFTFSHSYAEDFSLGESIAVNGMCVTVVAWNASEFSADIIEESRNRTIFSDSQVGDLVNLERSAMIGSRNSGHNVTGHIDETGEIIELEKESDFWRIRVKFSAENFPFVIFKGSIAINGISLTVSDVSKDSTDPWLEVSIIPHTWEVTNLQTLKIGDLVNLEFDQVGKYLAKIKN